MLLSLPLAVLTGYSLVEIAIGIVIIAAVAALVYIALKNMGIAIPPWVVQIFWIVALAVVVIVAIRVVAGL